MSNPPSLADLCADGDVASMDPRLLLLCAGAARAAAERSADEAAAAAFRLADAYYAAAALRSSNLSSQWRWEVYEAQAAGRAAAGDPEGAIEGLEALVHDHQLGALASKAIAEHLWAANDTETSGLGVPAFDPWTARRWSDHQLRWLQALSPSSSDFTQGVADLCLVAPPVAARVLDLALERAAAARLAARSPDERAASLSAVLDAAGAALEVALERCEVAGDEELDAAEQRVVDVVRRSLSALGTDVAPDELATVFEHPWAAAWRDWSEWSGVDRPAWDGPVATSPVVQYALACDEAAAAVQRLGEGAFDGGDDDPGAGAHAVERWARSTLERSRRALREVTSGASDGARQALGGEMLRRCLSVASLELAPERASLVLEHCDAVREAIACELPVAVLPSYLCLRGELRTARPSGLDPVWSDDGDAVPLDGIDIGVLGILADDALASLDIGLDDEELSVLFASAARSAAPLPAMAIAGLRRAAQDRLEGAGIAGLDGVRRAIDRAERRGRPLHECRAVLAAATLEAATVAGSRLDAGRVAGAQRDLAAHLSSTVLRWGTGAPNLPVELCTPGAFPVEACKALSRTTRDDADEVTPEGIASLVRLVGTTLAGHGATVAEVHEAAVAALARLDAARPQERWIERYRTALGVTQASGLVGWTEPEVDPERARGEGEALVERVARVAERWMLDLPELAVREIEMALSQPAFGPGAANGLGLRLGASGLVAVPEPWASRELSSSAAPRHAVGRGPTLSRRRRGVERAPADGSSVAPADPGRIAGGRALRRGAAYGRDRGSAPGSADGLDI